MAKEQEVTRIGDLTVRLREDGTPAGGRVTLRAVRESEEFPVDRENHRMWFRASTPGVKGDFYDLPVSSWAKFIQDYIDKNPVFIWAHQYWAEGFSTLDNILGHAVDFKIIDEGDPDRDGLYLLDDFAYGINNYATMAWAFYMRRDLNAVSVGFDVAEYHTEKREVEGGGEREVYVVDTAMLLEHSGCILPMDTDALAVGRSLPQEFAARARAYAEECPDVEVAMRALAVGNDPLALALRQVLADDYCAGLLCGITGGDPKETPKALEDEEKDLIREVVREVVPEVVAELYREKAFEPPAEPVPPWREKLADMIENTKDMTSEARDAALDDIKQRILAL